MPRSTPRRITPTCYQLAPASLQTTNEAAWLKMRRDGIGGSDVAPVIGLQAWGTRWQVWLDKTEALGDVPDERTPREQEQARFGHRMESVAAWEFRDRHPGVRTTRIGMLANIERPWMRVNLDYRVHRCPLGPCFMEIKNRGSWAAKEWDAAGDADRVPDAPLVQVQWGLAITGWDHAHLAVVLGGNELRDYTVKADPGLQATLIDECGWFWNDHVLTKVAPPVDAAERTGRILAQMWDADENKIVQAGPRAAELLAEMRAAAAEVTPIAERVKATQHELQVLMGDAEVLVDADGNQLVTWRQNGTFASDKFREERPALADDYTRTRDTIDTARLADDHPSIYREYRSRRFLVKTPKGTS